MAVLAPQAKMIPETRSPGVRLRAIIFFLLALTILVALLGYPLGGRPHLNMVNTAAEVSKWTYDGLESGGARNTTPRFRFSSVTGFFLQDDPDTNEEGFEYTKVSLGLIARTYETDNSFDPNREKTQWERFEHYVNHLNQSNSQNASYKVLYLGRHGQGDHNVAEAKYGTHDWDEYWSKLRGAGNINWTDAHLTDIGIGQARTANAFWRKELSIDRIPAPQRYYVSPLHRCLATANLTFSDLDLPRERPFTPEVKEMLRETLGVHYCDMRSSKTYIHEQYPSYTIEPSFSENDELWKADVRETDDEVASRLSILLDDVFEHDQSTFLSLTAHSGAIKGVLQAIGHRKFGLQTGGIIPVFVKAETW